LGEDSVLVLALRLQGMESRTWFKAVVLMCLLALGSGRGRFFSLLIPVLFARKRREKYVSRKRSE
jgi:hypothetical protein